MDVVGADVEIIEPVSEHGGDPADLPCIKPYRVRVNGTDVGLIKRGSIAVHPGEHGQGDDPATVTLTLLVRSVSIRAE